MGVPLTATADARRGAARRGGARAHGTALKRLSRLAACGLWRHRGYAFPTVSLRLEYSTALCTVY